MTTPESGKESIPEWLHSVEHERPFSECLVCSGRLVNRPAYTIIKSYRRHECVCELAICSVCIEVENQKWSEASRKTALEFHLRRREHHGHAPGECCEYCGKVLDRNLGVAIYARCRKDRVWATVHMCHGCEDAFHEGLSPETREEQDRFRRTWFPGPPDLAQPLPREAHPPLVTTATSALSARDSLTSFASPTSTTFSRVESSSSCAAAATPSLVIAATVFK